jgi:hypothetical protein
LAIVVGPPVTAVAFLIVTFGRGTVAPDVERDHVGTLGYGRRVVRLYG